MKLIADTNVLIRAVVQDDVNQSRIASKLLREATCVVVPTVVLCEFVWVLRRLYAFDVSEIAAALNALATAQNVELNGGAFDAGMAMLNAGGDFADGIIFHEGQWLGGEVFVSFDKDAVGLLQAQGHAAQVL
jgi:predicted nucleic-acid-binding protein